jgi:serine protease Do
MNNVRCIVGLTVLSGRSGQNRFRTLLLSAASVMLLIAGTKGVAETLSLDSQAALKRIYDGEAPSSLADLRAMETHQRQLSEKLIACTVGLRIGSAHGSGVIVTKDGYVLTAAHVAERPGRKADVVFPDGRKVTGKTLGVYRTLDAGLVKIDGDGPWPFAEMASRDPLKEGQWCIATGHPGGYQQGRQPVVRVGRVLLTGKFSVTTDCTLISGDSGGPLFNMDGRVIGINSRIGRFLEANLHVPITAYYDEWERLSKGENWGNFPGNGKGPYIGVQGESNSQEAKISSVVKDAPAAEAGIQPGDVVIRLGDKDISDFESLQLRVHDHRPGDQVNTVVRRGAQTVELVLTIGSK